MKERHLPWPQVDISNVDPDWWDEVMQSSSHFQNKYSQELDDAADFTIRAITHLVIDQKREDVEWFLEGSLQKERILAIHEKIHSSEENLRRAGIEDLVHLIEDYTKDVLEYEQGNGEENQ